jgi:selenide, water dikinase
MEKIRLTQFSHGGGCGCKISPSVLADILSKTPLRAYTEHLLVGNESSDDAAVYQLNASQAIIATTDFFTPIVDDAYDFGRIAATNALSDVYAMGGTPIFALAIVGMPIDKLPIESIQQILAGGESVCAAAGIPIAGGHSIDTLEPIYGLVAIGVAHPEKIKRNSSAQAGDVLILGKPLGVGVLSAALKKGLLSEEGYAQMLHYTTQLNRVGNALSELDGVHAMTDITGFGLAGHALEICRGSNMSAELRFSDIPLIDTARQFAEQGVVTGASKRNWASYGHDVQLDGNISAWQQHLLTDPQTSGGLLVSCGEDVSMQVLEIFHQQGFEQAVVIGRMQASPAVLRVMS